MNNRYTENAGYNGWTNYPTWCYMLWINNDYDNYRYWSELSEDCSVQEIADHLEEVVCEFVDNLYDENTISGMFHDLFGWTLEKINYWEIAESLYECHHKQETDA